MKSAIHPVMFQKAKTTCSSCKAVYEIPSTIEKQSVEVCRMCHPVYTGKAVKEARGGRVERFRKRQAAEKKGTASAKTSSTKVAVKKK